MDESTEPWGVKVERVEVKDVSLPVQLQRAMAAEAEASREARAKVRILYNIVTDVGSRKMENLFIGILYLAYR